MSFLSCYFCERTISDILIIPCCLTSVCSICFEKNITTSETTLKKIFNCAVCLKSIDNFNSLIQSKFLGKFIADSYKTNDNNEKSFICDRCETLVDSKNGLKCLDCKNMYFCKSCYECIHSVGKFKTHRNLKYDKQNKLYDLFFPKEVKLFCPKHEKKLAEFFCFKDYSLLCSICQGAHISCKSNSIKKLEFF